MKNFLLCLICNVIFLCSPLYSQSSDDFSFIGTIQLQDKSIITYKLLFSMDESGIIKGKSITDFSGDHRTESKIEGKISSDKKQIQFRETANILTRSDFPDSSFCYIHMPKGKIKLRKKKSIIQGYFVAKYKDNSPCLDGDIYLMGEEQFYKKISSSMKKARIFMSKEKYTTTKGKIDSAQINASKMILRADDKIVFKTALDTATLLVSDPQHEDGDIIAISVNGEVKFPNVKVLNKTTRINIPIEGRTVVSIKAVNEGRIPPNSARVLLDKSLQTDGIELQIKKGKGVQLIFEEE